MLQRSCEKVDLQGGQWDAAGHSPLYGFGRLNALTAVELAVPPATDRMMISKDFNEPIRDLQTTRVTLDVTEQRTLKDLKVRVDIRHSHIGDLVVAGLAGLAGAKSEGSWTLEVRDEALRGVGGIAGFGLELSFD